MYIANVADFQNVPTPVATGEYILGGYSSEGDGGGGTFVWVPVAPANLPNADDGIIFHHSNDNQGYFKRIYSGPLNVRWFGAKGDGVTDDTAAVHAARDAAKSGTIYFPESFDADGNELPYVGAFVFDKRTSILGDGLRSVLRANDSGDPVLTLGHGHPYSAYKPTIAKIVIDGYSPVQGIYGSDGVRFEDVNPPFPSLSGRWLFENVWIKRCHRGIYKPQGNFGNVFRECWFHNNQFGYYAEGYYSSTGEMHAGCDRFEGGSLIQNFQAAICVVAGGDEGYGQFILDGTVIDSNSGFGIFVKLSDQSVNRMPVAAVELRNVWTEANAMPLYGSDLISQATSRPEGWIGGRLNGLSLELRLNISYSFPNGVATGAEIREIASSTQIVAIPNFPLTQQGNWDGYLPFTNAQALALLAGDYEVVIFCSLPGSDLVAQLPARNNPTIDGITYDYLNGEVYDYYFEQLRGVMITGSMLRDRLKAIASSVMLVNCRSYSAVDIDEETSVVADQLRFIGTPSENIFVNSISYDGTMDIANLKERPSSVWGPLRTTLVKKSTIPFHTMLSTVHY